MAAQNLKPVQRLLDEYAGLQMKWRSSVATPLLRHPDQQLPEMDKNNKTLSDSETSVVQAIRAALEQTNSDLARSTQTQLERVRTPAHFGCSRSACSRSCSTASTRDSIANLKKKRIPPKFCSARFAANRFLCRTARSAAHLSAGSHLAVGGDVFDVYRLSNTLALVLIADVSGKGVDAAVLTAFIKFTIRGIALRRRDPGAILAEFNTAFSQTVENPYLFVSMFVGVLDTETFQLRYASAGHDSAFMRRSNGGVQQLAVTGPVLGVMEEPFGTKSVVMEDGDTLVLATDGLTEARKRTGEQLRETGAMDLIEHASVEPQLLADELVAQVRALGGNHLRDDLAILAIRVSPPAPAPAPETPHA